MLYIDQPDQTGLSYDILANGTQDLTDDSGNVTISDFSSGVPTQNNSFLVGTFPSQLLNSSANGTTNAARALYVFRMISDTVLVFLICKQLALCSSLVSNLPRLQTE
jgi:hypothetical protein